MVLDSNDTLVGDTREGSGPSLDGHVLLAGIAPGGSGSEGFLGSPPGVKKEGPNRHGTRRAGGSSCVVVVIPIWGAVRVLCLPGRGVPKAPPAGQLERALCTVARSVAPVSDNSGYTLFTSPVRLALLSFQQRAMANMDGVMIYSR